MKKFLLHIGLFVILIGVVAVMCDYMVSSGLRKTTIRKYAVWNDIYNGDHFDNEAVIIGASSCWAHYDPHILDSILGISTYNLGIDGHTWYPCQPLRYYTYVRYARRPSIVVMNIDMGTFGAPLPDPYEREQFFPYFWLDDSLITQIQECKEITWMERYCPMWRYIGYRTDMEQGVTSFFGKQHFVDDGVYKGHRGNEYEWDRASLKTLDSLKVEHVPEVIENFIDFAKERKAEGQDVILVKTPIYKELQNRFCNRLQMCELYDSIAAVIGAPLLDYWDVEIVADSTYFYNPSHLNKQGAKWISVRLAHDIKAEIE